MGYLVILLETLCVFSFSASYTSFKIFSGNECQEDTYIVDWVFPLPSLCTFFPFHIYQDMDVVETDFSVIYSYNETSQHLIFTEYTSPLGEEICAGEPVRVKNYTVDTNECFVFQTLRNVVYGKIFVHDSFPVNLDSSKSYMSITFDNFQKRNCQSPYNLDDNFEDRNITIDTTVSLLTGGEYRLKREKYYTSGYYCTTNWFIVEQLRNDEVHAYKLFHYSPGECVGNFIDAFSPIVSTKYTCQTGLEALMYQKSLPSKSSHKFIVKYYHWESECLKPATVSQFPLDVCQGNHVDIFNEDSGYIKYYFESFVCEGVPLSIGIKKYGDIRKCHATPYYTSHGIKLYARDDLLDVVYYPSNVAVVSTFEDCSDFDYMHFLKNRGIHERVNYFDQFTCLNNNQFLEISDVVPFKSTFIKCDKGKIFGYNFTQSDVCSGYYSEFTENLCVETSYGYSYYVLCIPHFCGDYTEFEEEVCSGRGECILNDFCECLEGWGGSKCETLQCDGINFDSEEVCNSRGKCTGPNICECEQGLSYGDFCEHLIDDKSKDLYIIAYVLGPITLIVFIVSIFLLVFVGVLIFCICCFCFLCCFFLILVLCFCVSGGSVVLKIILNQRMGIRKFRKLKNFDLYLSEQLLEEDESIAHLRINKDLFRIPYKELKVLNMIGEGGSQAICYKTRWQGKIVALKCFKTRFVCSDQNLFDSFEKEVQIIASINHPFIVRFYGATMEVPRVGIVMEYCEKGELFEFISSYRTEHGKKYPILEKVRFCQEISASMSYIHSRSIIHRDLKCENVLIDSEERTKLMDFGLSKFVQDRIEESHTQKLGTSFYIAPEIMNGSGRYNEKCDVYSYAILIYIIFSENEKPFGEKVFNIQYRIANDSNLRPSVEKMEEEFAILEKEEGIDLNWIIRMMKRAWSHDPLERSDFVEIQKEIEIFLDSEVNRKTISKKEEEF